MFIGLTLLFIVCLCMSRMASWTQSQSHRSVCNIVLVLTCVWTFNANPLARWHLRILFTAFYQHDGTIIMKCGLRPPVRLSVMCYASLLCQNG